MERVLNVENIVLRMADKITSATDQYQNVF